MSEDVPRRLPVLPYNPGVRDLVQGKRRYSPGTNQLGRRFHGWHERGYLPHRDEPHLTQFVTFHLADSFPAALRCEWAHLVEIEDDRQRRKKLEEYLDKGRGDCWLRRPDVAAIVEANLIDFSGRDNSGCGDVELRYELRAWCIMPNHVHVLFKTGSASMGEIVGGWKKNSGRLANRLLRRRGAFWIDDYFDVYMRDAEHERRTIRYIESNPTKAGLVLNPRDWPWSSARFRDEYGRLVLPD